MMPVPEQIRSFVFTVGIGALMGLLFDLYRAWRYLARPGRVVTHLGDVLVWLVLTPITFILLLKANGGDMRTYVLLAMGLGAVGYARWFSRGSQRFFRRTLRLVARTWRWTVMVMLWPWRLTFWLLHWPLALTGLTFWQAGRIGRGLWRRARAGAVKVGRMAFRRRPPPPPA